MIDLGGGEARQLTSISTGANNGIWAPDGKTVAFVSAVFPENSDKPFADADKRGRLRLIASPEGRDGSVVIHQDSEIFAAVLNDGEAVTHELKSGRKGWVQVVRGEAVVNGETVRTGDGVALENEAAVSVTARSDDSEVLVFDLP